jgi:hypothetical protein
MEVDVQYHVQVALSYRQSRYSSKEKNSHPDRTQALVVPTTELDFHVTERTALKVQNQNHLHASV